MLTILKSTRSSPKSTIRPSKAPLPLQSMKPRKENNEQEKKIQLLKMSDYWRPMHSFQGVMMLEIEKS